MKPRAFALDDNLVSEIDDYARRLEAEHPGLVVTRSGAVRALLKKGLEANDSNETECGPEAA